MDNFRIDVTSEGDLGAAMALAFSKNSQGAVGYSIHRTAGLIFYWFTPDIRNCEDRFVAFPFKADPAYCADFAKRWLATQDYGKEPDHDGDNGRGWRIYNETWGHVQGRSSAICAVQPAWAMYGK